MIFYEPQEKLLEYCSSKIDHAGTFDPAKSVAIGFLEKKTGGEGVVVFTVFGDEDMELSWAGHGIWTKKNLREVFDYVYNRHHARRATVIILKRDKKTRKLAERLGFRHEGTHPETFGCETSCSYGMLKRNCRWIENGSISSSSGNRKRLIGDSAHAA